MPPKATKPAAKEPEGPTSSETLASLMTEHKADHYNDIVPQNLLISTGSLILDQYVKIRSGSVVRLLGRGAELGKTSEAFVLAANFMAVVPKSKTLYIKAEGRLTPEARARSGQTFVNAAADWDYGTIFVLSMNVFETCMTIVETLLKQMHERGERLCVIADSMDGFILKKDLEVKDISGNTMVAGVPKLTKLLFRRLALPITHYDALFVMLSQYSTDIKLDPYAPAAPRQGTASGGSSIMHQADYCIQYAPRYNGDNILEDPDQKPDPVKNKIIGIWATPEILKSAADTTGTKVKVPIKKGRIGCAIWVEKEVADLLISWECYKKSGSWLTLQEDNTFVKDAAAAGVSLKEKIQGLNGLYEYIETDRAAFEWLLARFKQVLGGEA